MKFSLSLLVFLFSFIVLQAQTKGEKKEEKKVVIIKKSIDENGKETVEETILEGEDAKKFDPDELDMGKEKEHKIIRIETEEEIENSGKKEVKKQVEIMKISLDGDEELTPEMIKELEEHGVDINDLGERKRIIRIEKDREEEKEEVIIKKRKHDDGQTLKLSSLNINVDVNNKKKTLDLAFSAPKEATTVRIIDVEGKMVYTQVFKTFIGKYEQIIDLSKAATGPVFLTIQQKEKVFSDLIRL